MREIDTPAQIDTLRERLRRPIACFYMDRAFTRSHRAGSGSPLLCIHGFTDTWRSWDLVRPALERRHDVLAVTLHGHAGGPPIQGELTEALLADGVERAMDAEGFETAHIVGNSLGGFVSLQLAARGRARSVVALAPAGGWVDEATERATIAYFKTLHPLVLAAAPHADALMGTAEGRRNATQFVATNYEHIPGELLAHQLRGAAACTAMLDMLEFRERQPFDLDADAIDCPVRIVWGTEDRILPWPAAAARYRDEWLPDADWVELDGIGHCPQLDVPLETAELILGFVSLNS
jgi:pimeloyl-ACP methyl ester carboxylesterase